MGYIKTVCFKMTVERIELYRRETSEESLTSIINYFTQGNVNYSKTYYYMKV